MNRHLLIVDPQVDFCDPYMGSLYVKNAEKDMYNLAKLIDFIGIDINKIHVTLDNHRLLHISHPIFWVDRNGEHPKPFTPILQEQVENGVWRASLNSYQQTALDYIRTLTSRNKTHIIWPEHCIVNSTGASVYPILFHALMKWEGKYNMVSYINKGMAIRTEMFGAFEAECPDPNYPSTEINMEAIKEFLYADEILIAGEALNFCVAETVRQLAKYINPSKFILLSDCTSNVVNYEYTGDLFIKELTEKGMKVCKSTEII